MPAIPSPNLTLGLIGGSGLYRMPALANASWRPADTPWGKPSDDLLHGHIGDLRVVFVPRHGRGHRLAPHEINYRANIAALKQAGCTMVVALSACGSYRDHLPPGTFAIIDQYVDQTHGRARSFFGDGVVAHVSLAEPTARDLADRIEAAARAADIPHHRGATYLAMDGPQFATRAESLARRAAGHDVVGMTGMPEAALACEAELAYAAVAMVTDFDAWKDHAVTTADVLQVMAANARNAESLVVALAAELTANPLPLPSAQGWERALDGAIVTPRELWPTAAAERLRTIAGRLL